MKCLHLSKSLAGLFAIVFAFAALCLSISCVHAQVLNTGTCADAGCTHVIISIPTSAYVPPVTVTPPPNTTPTVTYDAAKNTYAGCVIAPNDSVFSARVDTLPVAANSSTWISTMTSYGKAPISVTGSWGINLANTATPKVPMNFHYTTVRNGMAYPIPAVPDRKRETGSLTTDNNNDHHMVTVDPTTCHIYETYQEGNIGSGGYQYVAASGWDYLGTSYQLPTGGSTDAAGLPLAPLMLRHKELTAGVINHALRFTACAGCISGQFVWPAQGTTGGTSGAPPMGSRFRLKSSINTSTASPMAQAIWTALRQYGMILADIGGTGQIQASTDVYADPAASAALAEIYSAGNDLSAFEVVDESSLMSSQTSSQIANSTANPTDPIGIGAPYDTYTVQAGAQLPLAAWVSNSQAQAITWVLNGPGSIVNGVYIAPTTLGSTTTATVTGTAIVDPTATFTITIRLIPAGAIRLDVGNTSPYTDTNGNTWLPDTYTQESGSFSSQNDNYPAGLWGSTVDAALYQTYIYTWGDDIMYGPYVMPPGKYNVTFYFAHAGCSGTYDPTAQFDNGLVWGPMMTEINGQDQLYTPSNACRTPELVTRTVFTNSGLIRLGVRSTGGNNAHSAPYINAFSIVPATN